VFPNETYCEEIEEEYSLCDTGKSFFFKALSMIKKKDYQNNEKEKELINFFINRSISIFEALNAGRAEKWNGLYPMIETKDD
jgi:hypothetical protein